MGEALAKGAVYLITGDIGGTNSRMFLYTMENDRPVTKNCISVTYRNEKQYPESALGDRKAFIDYVLNPFLIHCWKPETQQQCGITLEPIVGVGSSSINVTLIACIASAGFVSDNQVRLTNLGNVLISGHLIEEDQSSEYMARLVKCIVINDFVAQGYGCLTLKPPTGNPEKDEVRHLYGPKDREVFSPDTTTAKGPKVCVGAGTGLGECYLTQSVHMSSHDPYSCFGSEGGHVEFAPRNALEVELWQYIGQKYYDAPAQRISVERIVSGKGLANIYEFLALKFPKRVVPTVHEEFLEAGDEQGRIVALNAMEEGTICHQAMTILMNAYGCEVGSAAMKWTPTGGLFVSGGLTPKNIKWIEGINSPFMKSYLDKGRVSPLLERIPLYAVMVEDLGVRGALNAALVAYENYCEEDNNYHNKNKSRSKSFLSSLSIARLSSFSQWSWLETTLVMFGAATLGSLLTTSLMVRRR